MKILFLHEERGKEIAVNLSNHLEKYAVEGEILLLEDWESSGPSLKEALDKATHVLAICAKAEGSNHPISPWLVFAAGFSRGAHLPFLVYGDESPLPSWFAKDVLQFNSEVDFSAYLEREAAKWFRERSVQQAREALLERGIPVTVAALGHCIGEKDLEAVKLFLQAGFAPDTLDKAGVPLLCLAARAGDRDISALLLENGASVNTPAGDRGGAALIDAALGKHTDILRDLLAAGADPNAKSKDGQSALIIAVGLNDEPTVELLLKSGANVDDPDSLGVSARKYATLFNRPGIVALFQTYASAGAEQ